MADSKGNDPKPTESKTGAIKPPVLDLKARETTAGKPTEAGQSVSGGHWELRACRPTRARVCCTDR